MDSSRLEAHRLELLRERVDIAALVRASVARAALTAPQRTVDVRVQLDLPEVEADPGSHRGRSWTICFLQIALKHARCGTPILVEAARIDGDQISMP